MKKASQTVLTALLEECPSEKRAALLSFLPERLRTHTAPLDKIVPERFGSSLLDLVHWSWFLPTLEAYTEEEQRLFLSALSPFASKNLAKMLHIASKEDELPSIARSYLRKVLFDSLSRSGEFLPAEYVPQSPLSPLLKLSKKELVQLISFLSLHDLAEEVRQIVETKMLKKIYSFLSEEEKAFLKNAAVYKESLSLGRLLDRWDGSEESFKALLQKRGLVRLAVALSGQDPDLLWHVCHQLDIGRGNALFKLCAKEAHPMRHIVVRQIEELI